MIRVDWRLTPMSVLRLPPPVLLRVARDLVTRRLVEGESFGALARSALLPRRRGPGGAHRWIDLQRSMLHEMQTHRGFNRYLPTIDHQAYVWFLRPVYYIDVGFGPGGPTLLIAITNPAVWLLTLPAIAHLAYRARKDRLESQRLLLALFAASYLPFLVTRRPIWVALAAICAAPLYLLATGEGLKVGALKPIVAVFRPEEERSRSVRRRVAVSGPCGSAGRAR